MRNSVTIFLAAVPLVGVLATPAPAAEWWRSWSGSSVPEDVGYFHGGQYDPAKRWLNDGMLWIDSREPYGRYSYYMIWPKEAFGPEPNEVFVMRWRVQVLESAPYGGGGSVGVASDYGYTMGLSFEPDKFWVFAKGLYSVPITAGVFHEYEVRSTDMRQYDLFVDSSFVLHESFYKEPSRDPRFGWGDDTASRGLSSWDYFDIGVRTLSPAERARPIAFSSTDRAVGLAPEPGPAMSLSMMLALLARRRL